MIGDKINQYQIIELLGEGGMGTVYRAKDTILDREVAIKMIHKHHQHQEVLLARFKNEALLSARINHPNVTTLLQFSEVGSTGYLIMEYVKGQNLEKILELHGTLSATSVLQILMQLLEGLEHAHQKGIIHRDIKPGNIMLSDDGYIKLMDFGIARIEESNRLTKLNHVIGTTAYMAPEILKGTNPSVASDLYAVGIVACELLTGKTPFDSATDASMINQILYKDPLIKTKTTSGIEKNLIRIIKKLLSKNPAKRFSSAQALLKELQDMGGIYTRIKIQPTISNVRVLSGSPDSINNYLGRLKGQLENFSFTGLEQFGKTTEGRIILGSLLLALIIFATSMITSNLQDRQIVETKMPESAIDAHISLSDYEIRKEIPQYLNQNNEETALGDIDTAENQSETNPGGVDKKEQPKSPPRTIEKPIPAPPLNAGKEEVQEKDDSDLLVSNPDSPDLQPVKEAVNQDEKPNPSVVSIEQPESLTTEKASGQKSEIISVRIPEQYITAAFTSQISSEHHRKNDIVYLQNQNPVLVNGYLIIAPGARIKAVVRESYSSRERARASLAIEFVAVEAIDGSWLDLQYPLYSNKGKNEVVFMNGSMIQKLKLKGQSMRLQN